jgi:hypothetical protein
MRFRTTIVLILLLLGLGAYVYWVEYPEAQEEAKKKTLFEFKPEDVAEISLVYADREINLKRSGDDWQLTKPIDVAADAVTARNLANTIAECEVKKELTDASSDLTQYGLDSPFVTVTVKLKDRELTAILVGKNAPVGSSTYVQKADDKRVLLTSSTFRAGVDKKVKDLRDKTILTFADKDVQKVGIRGEGKDIRLVQKDDAWNIEQPGPYAADATAMRSFLSTLRSLRAADFPDDQPTDLSTYGLDHPRLQVALYLGKDSIEKRLLIGKETDKKEIYVQQSDGPAVYTVSDWVFRDLNKNVGDFRDKTVLAFDRDKVTALEIKPTDGSPVKLVRGENKQWQVEGNEGKAAETVISQYLSDLRDLKGYEIAMDNPADLSPFGLDNPLLALTVVGEENATVGTVLLGQRETAEAKEYAAMTAGGPTVFLVRDYLVTRLNKQLQDFVEHPTPTAGAGTTGLQVGGGAREPEEEDLQDESFDEEVAGEQD